MVEIQTGAEQVSIIWNKIKVVVENNSLSEALFVINLSIFSFISNTTAIEIISMIMKTNVPRNFFIMYQSSRPILKISFFNFIQLLIITPKV